MLLQALKVTSRLELLLQTELIVRRMCALGYNVDAKLLVGLSVLAMGNSTSMGIKTACITAPSTVPSHC
jgi:hypothetical protein